jgi:HNH endonuclease
MKVGDQEAADLGSYRDRAQAAEACQARPEWQGSGWREVPGGLASSRRQPDGAEVIFTIADRRFAALCRRQDELAARVRVWTKEANEWAAQMNAYTAAILSARTPAQRAQAEAASRALATDILTRAIPGNRSAVEEYRRVTRERKALTPASFTREHASLDEALTAAEVALEAVQENERQLLALLTGRPSSRVPAASIRITGRTGLNGGHPVGELRTRAPIPRAIKQQVWIRDGGRCRHCGITDAEAMARDGEHLQYDHIIPFSRNGADTASNIQLLCGRCNRAKSDH